MTPMARSSSGSASSTRTLLLLSRPGLEHEGGDAGVARPALIGIVAGRAYPLDLHLPVPVRSGSNGAAVGAEADQRRVLAETLACELPDIVLAAHLAHFGEGRVADMGVVRPDHRLGVRPALGEQALQRVEHMLVAQIPRRRVAVIVAR